MGIGNGIKWTHFARLRITGNEGIPNVLTCIDSVNFAALAFAITPDGIVDYDPATGIFTFKRKGLVDIAATLNIDTTLGVTEVELQPEYDSGAGFVKTSARTAELPVIGAAQTTLEGTLEQVDKGHRLRFFVRSPDASASFKTTVLPDGGVVPAAILHLKMWTR